MINQNNIKVALLKLGFFESGNVFTKKFPHLGDVALSIDFDKTGIWYPENAGLKVNERQTCNFSADENFVVFECVCRLFEKGYSPKHIELEPKWKLGHGASGGRADIWVKDNDGNSLLIIECKTAGKEFEDAWKDTLEDGGQLFSYFQQEKSTQFVALYASDFVNDEVTFDYRLIAVRDNEEYLKSFGKREVPSFKNADTVKKVYKAWVETYQKDFSTRGLFESDIAAYRIGKTKYSAADLKEIDSDSIQKKYHEFATILRQHNVSGHENAFDKLVNLFLAKIVDENTNKEELAFYWKGAAYDDVKSLIDRLQKHYKIGMEKFLNEDVTYIDKQQIDDAFRLFKNKPDATRETILDYFDQLKYYTNNDFAFIDVHNENLFKQNAEVLLKIVQMLQDIKLQTETQNQFLGDLFEGFLDKGVKQSEGQFFTPMPIVKFLVSSLPLEKIICGSPEIPRVIDYACGAGHFLNEYANQIVPFIKKSYVKENIKITIFDPRKIKEYYAKITGIEKEYRLSKVAKVSAFMYGQDDIQIIYGDALAKNRKIKEGAYSILVSNPPYSVKGFLSTLDESSRSRFELAKTVSDIHSNNSIETFFVERAKQLLQGGGVAAVILPSSILSNGNIYIKMREILLKHFDIAAIAEFGSGTFGKTGTNTAALFLRRKNSHPALAEHYKNRVEAWFSGDFSADATFCDKQLLRDYCAHISVDYTDYKTLLKGKPNENLLQMDIFKEYRKDFEQSVKFKAITKKKITEKYSEDDKETEYQKAWIAYLQDIEGEKLYFYMLAASNPHPVVIVKSPADSKELKTFLGYEWSAAKGSEGIKYIGANVVNNKNAISADKGINQIKTPLFNPHDLDDETKINVIIRGNFSGVTPDIPENLKDLVSLTRLVDMIDFNRAAFDKALKTTSEKKMEIASKYPLVKLGGEDGICEILIGGTPSRRITDYFTGKNLWVSIAEMNGNIITDTKEKITDEAVSNSNVKLIPKGTTLLSFKLNIGKTAIAGVDLYTNEAIAGLIPKDKKQVLDKYLFCFFSGRMIDLENVGAKVFGKSLNSVYLKNEIKIPLPPLDIQEQIVAECEKVDAEYNTSRMSIEEYKKKIAKIFENL
ncbi:MAG: N-6 DNA methylase [Treponema sp.]|jgi:type I restriction-modification system DNA methylase subunit|nr:N-6 DNA methylase [Treponema sp.]